MASCTPAILALLAALATPAAGLELVSATPDGGFPAPYGMPISQRLGSSADGQVVLFQSYANDLAAAGLDQNGLVDVFVRDRALGVTTLASIDAAGTASASAGAFSARLSADGGAVAYTSTSTDLVAGSADGNGPTASDAFVRDLASAATELVSVNAAGTASGNAESTALAISADGACVLFSSNATDLVAGFVDANGPTRPDLFVRDRQAAVTHWVSRGIDGQGANREVGGALLSADCRRVVFASAATNLVAGGIDANQTIDVFVHDLQSGATSLVSLNLTGTASAAGPSRNPRISADGGLVAFSSTATDLAAGFVDGNGDGEDLYLRDLAAGETRLVSVNAAGSASGNRGTLSAGDPYALSEDGRWIAFPSPATDLVGGVTDTNLAADVFLRDLASGTTILVSAIPSGTRTGGSESLRPQVAINGTVLFDSESTDLVPGLRSGVRNLFVRTPASGALALVTASIVRAGGADASPTDAVLSADGRIVVFASAASDLLAGDTNGSEDVFAYDVLAPPTPTPTRTRTAPPSPTASRTATPSASATPTLSPTPLSSPTDTAAASPTATAPRTAGDCNGNGAVTVDELVRGVNIALGSAALDSCPSFDPNGDGMVAVNELVRAVANALGA
ncbi:MAG: hypothetical protein SF182_19455 [Deltaproteobacteria bacterium]|nr:hypothetical protein [Deltaproteobacteria bacterium]